MERREYLQSLVPPKRMYNRYSTSSFIRYNPVEGAWFDLGRRCAGGNEATAGEWRRRRGHGRRAGAAAAPPNSPSSQTQPFFFRAENQKFSQRNRRECSTLSWAGNLNRVHAPFQAQPIKHVDFQLKPHFSEWVAQASPNSEQNLSNRRIKRDALAQASP